MGKGTLFYCFLPNLLNNAQFITGTKYLAYKSPFFFL